MTQSEGAPAKASYLRGDGSAMQLRAGPERRSVR